MCKQKTHTTQYLRVYPVSVVSHVIYDVSVNMQMTSSRGFINHSVLSLTNLSIVLVNR